MPSVPWDEIRANRVLVAHIYHRIDYEILWETLRQDVPRLATELGNWQHQERSLGQDREQAAEQDSGPGISF